ncbi:MAG: hypothetical protein RSB70_00545 [Clostridium sp.]
MSNVFIVLGVISLLLYYLIGIRKNNSLISFIDKIVFKITGSNVSISKNLGNILLVIVVLCFTIIGLKYIFFIIGKLFSLAILVIITVFITKKLWKY